MLLALLQAMVSTLGGLHSWCGGARVLAESNTTSKHCPELDQSVSLCSTDSLTDAAVLGGRYFISRRPGINNFGLLRISMVCCKP